MLFLFGMFCSMGRMMRILEKDWYSLTWGKLSDSVIDVVMREISKCFSEQWFFPAVWIGTDSQKLERNTNYLFSSVIVLHLWNKFNRIFYTTFSRTFRTTTVDAIAFAARNIKRLTDEGRMTINIAQQLCLALQDRSMEEIIPELHFDYNLDNDYASHRAYQAIQELVQTLTFVNNPLYKPDALWATKAADRIIRKKK